MHHTGVLTPDHTHLTFGHHKVIIAALALLPQLQTCCTCTQSTDNPSDQSKSAMGVGEACKSASKAGGMPEGVDPQQMKLLVVGLGGGVLPMFINKCIPNVSYCGFYMTVHVYLCAYHMYVLSQHTDYEVAK